VVHQIRKKGGPVAGKTNPPKSPVAGKTNPPTSPVAGKPNQPKSPAAGVNQAKRPNTPNSGNALKKQKK